MEKNVKDHSYGRKGYLNATSASHQFQEMDQIDLTSPINNRGSNMSRGEVIKDNFKKQVIIDQIKSPTPVKKDSPAIQNNNIDADIAPKNYNTIAEIGIGSASNSINSQPNNKDQQNIDDNFADIPKPDKNNQILYKIPNQKIQSQSSPAIIKNDYLFDSKVTVQIKINQKPALNNQQKVNQLKPLEKIKEEYDPKSATSIKYLLQQPQTKQSFDEEIQGEDKSINKNLKAPEIDKEVSAHKTIDKSEYETLGEKNAKIDTKNPINTNLSDNKIISTEVNQKPNFGLPIKAIQERNKSLGFQLKNKLLQKSKQVNQQNVTFNNGDIMNKVSNNKNLVDTHKKIFPQQNRENIMDEGNGEIISTQRVLKLNSNQPQKQNNRNQERGCCSCDIF